jgi:RHS repeat-associated protein
MCKTYSISIKLFPDPNGQCQSLAGTLPVVATSSNGTTFTCVVGPVKVYSCPTGATLSGTSCITPVTQAASISGYTCASGTLSGSSCLMTTTTVATGSYSCPSGDTLSGSSCLVVSRTRYEPYGKTAAGTLPTWIGFTGHVNDADTGLVYMQQRYYDPIAARFLSTDPVTTDANTGTAFGRYVYAQSNPYRYTDPDGRQACQFCNWVTIYLSNDYGTHEKPQETVAPPVRAETAQSQNDDDELSTAMEARGNRGNQGKGERGTTSKPEKPLKGVKPIRDGNGKIVGWTVPTADGKGKDKSLDWGTQNGLKPEDFNRNVQGPSASKVAGGLLAIGAGVCALAEPCGAAVATAAGAGGAAALATQ